MINVNIVPAQGKALSVAKHNEKTGTDGAKSPYELPKKSFDPHLDEEIAPRQRANPLNRSANSMLKYEVSVTLSSGTSEDFAGST